MYGFRIQANHIRKGCPQGAEYENITIEKLAEMVDMSERQIQNIEKGKSNPKLSTIIAIVRALECVFVIREDGSFTLSKTEPDQKQPA